MFCSNNIQARIKRNKDNTKKDKRENRDNNEKVPGL